MISIIYTISINAQEIDVGEAEMETITISEWNISLVLNTSGGGFGFQYGKTPKYKNKHLWELEFSYYINYKAVLGKTYSQGRSFQYGKLYDFFFLRGGYGYQRIIAHKPYSGGVQIRYFFSAGAVLQFGLPTYLEIIEIDPDGLFYTKTERYNPADPDHYLGNIYGAASFFSRFHKISVRPGFYGKTGLNFDFSNNPLKMQVLEVGVSMDMVFPFVKQMHENKAKPAYFYAYLAYSFGKKKPKYEKDKVKNEK